MQNLVFSPTVYLLISLVNWYLLRHQVYIASSIFCSVNSRIKFIKKDFFYVLFLSIFFSGRNLTERKEIYGEFKTTFIDSVDKVSCLVSESMNTDSKGRKISRGFFVFASTLNLTQNDPLNLKFCGNSREFIFLQIGQKISVETKIKINFEIFLPLKLDEMLQFLLPSMCLIKVQRFIFGLESLKMDSVLKVANSQINNVFIFIK